MSIFEVLAHEGEEVVRLQPSLDDVIRSNSLTYVLIASGLLLILIIISHFFKDRNPVLKLGLFITIIAVIVLTTLYLTGSTIYLNIKSVSGGPVHYHADFEIWNCGQKVELKDPEGLSNRVGSSTVHEHNDDRIHIEGVIYDNHDLMLHHFFEEIGGDLDDDGLSILTEAGSLELRDDQTCPDGKPAKLQVFVYQTQLKNYKQVKLSSPKDYQISPHSQVPPGDCVIFEYDSADKDKTDKICQSLEMARKSGRIHGD